MAERSGEVAVEFVTGEQVGIEPVRWLWPQWLALGKLHLLAGSPGTGKTTISVSLAAAITTGRAWPGGGPAQTGDVLFWSGEDGIGDTLMPRFLAAGGDPRRVHFAQDVRRNGRSRTFDPAEDLGLLARCVQEFRDLKLVVLDPVVSILTGDTHKNGETRRGLQPVVNLARDLDVAVIGITHLSKGTSGREPLERVVGSIAFGAVARIVLATVKARDPGQPHRLIRAKSNLGPDSGGIEYGLISATVPGHDFSAQRIEWGQSLEGSALDLMSIEGENELDALSNAEAFLEHQLADGPVVTADLKAAAQANGHKWRTVERAKTELGVKAQKGPGGRWYWALPAEADTANQDRHRQTDDVGGVGGEAEHQIRELEGSIERQREIVRTLAATGQCSAEASQLLQVMEETLQALRGSDARSVE